MTDQENKTENTPRTAEAPSAAPLQVGVRLQPVGNSDQPVFCNVTAVQGVAGTVFVDFGFVEPQAFGALARRGQAGEKLPEAVGGRLACRVAMGVDVALALSRQLGQLLGGRSAAQAPAPAAAPQRPRGRTPR